MALAAWTEVKISTMTVIVKVIYKIIPYVFPQFIFDGDDWKVDVNNRKGILQTRKI